MFRQLFGHDRRGVRLERRASDVLEDIVIQCPVLVHGLLSLRRQSDFRNEAARLELLQR